MRSTVYGIIIEIILTRGGSVQGVQGHSNSFLQYSISIRSLQSITTLDTLDMSDSNEKEEEQSEGVGLNIS